jgi:Fanconi anemia group M protein
MAGEIESELTQTGMDEFADAGGGGDAPPGTDRADGSVPHETGGEPAADTSEVTSESEDPAPETEESATDSRPSSGDGEAGGGGGDGQAGLDAFAGGESGGGEASSGPGSDESADRDEPDGAVATASADDDESVEIVVDQRELDAAIAKDLSRQAGIVTRLETLAVGDYVLSDRVVVERKTVSDFLDTLTGDDERSLFEQLTDATRYYARPVVVVEGEDLYGERNVHPNAINGALASIAVDFGASVLRTADADETRELMSTIAAREQEEEDRTVSVHGEKSSKTLAEQQEYVVASVAEVGPVTAESLLAEFGSVEAVMTADADDLMTAEGVGEVTAERVREVVGSDYDG